MIESILNKLSKVSERFKEIESLLNQPDITKDQENYVKISKEYADLSEVVGVYQDFLDTQSAIKEAALLTKDKDTELQRLAEVELKELKRHLVKLELSIKGLLLPKDPDDSKNVFLEVRAGAGGDEAALFAGDLFRMYSRLAERNNWKMEIISAREGYHGGFKELITRIEGTDVYKQLKFEAGIHRVQRVPTTESQGRIHTSACSVAVLAEMDTPEEINLDKNDIRIDTFRASGSGGQHVNKTDSAIRITHSPTGIVVECQEDRSQHKNKEKALSLLKAKLLVSEKEKNDAEVAQNRKIMVGSGDRSEKIRTYNFPQNRITDHRIEVSVHNLVNFLDGDMTSMISSLLEENQARALANLEKNSR
tara:strand:- start:695 stop:1786 length:1092 start_codon:yes stop_codon:yes gene_type:complete